MLCMMLSAGLSYPRITYIWMAVYCAGRIWYQLGYAIGGAKARYPALPIILLTQMAFPIFTLVATIRLGIDTHPAFDKDSRDMEDMPEV